MSQVLVDSNVLLDILTEDEIGFEWSADTLEHYATHRQLCINPIIYADDHTEPET